MELDEQDAQIARIAAALRPLPAVNDEARARLLVAVAAEREADRAPRRHVRRAPRLWGAAGAALAAAALFTIWVKTETPVAAGPSAPTATTETSAPATLATHDAGAEPPPVPVELMLNAPAAQRVRLVGDFTGWDAKGVEMRRDAASGLWSGTALVRPGRHVYAFIVDDSIWMRDPRAPVAPDSDFGQSGSLLIVGRP